MGETVAMVHWVVSSIHRMIVIRPYRTLWVGCVGSHNRKTCMTHRLLIWVSDSRPTSIPGKGDGGCQLLKIRSPFPGMLVSPIPGPCPGRREPAPNRKSTLFILCLDNEQAFYYPITTSRSQLTESAQSGASAELSTTTGNVASCGAVACTVSPLLGESVQ